LSTEMDFVRNEKGIRASDRQAGVSISK